MSGTGHPRHQLRKMTVRLRYGAGAGRAHPVEVVAQTEPDAILRAGLFLAAAGVAGDPAMWRVAGVDDPAPFTWAPGQDGGRP
jgi:hypothetical protein